MKSLSNKQKRKYIQTGSTWPPNSIEQKTNHPTDRKLAKQLSKLQKAPMIRTIAARARRKEKVQQRNNRFIRRGLKFQVE